MQVVQWIGRVWASCDRRRSRRAGHPPMAARMAAGLAAAMGSLMLAGAACAADVTIPLNLPFPTLHEALMRYMYSAPGGRAELWNGSDNCQFLYAKAPQFSAAGSAVDFQTDAYLALGLEVAGRCVTPISWNGIIEARLAPYLAPDFMLRFRVEDLNLLNPAREKTLIAGRGFDLVKQHFIPRLEQFSFDLRPPVREVNQLIALGAPPALAQRVREAFATLRSVPPLAAAGNAVRVTLRLTVPDLRVPAAVATNVPLTPTDIEAWQKALDHWDAFVVFAIKQIGLTVKDPEIRQELFELLIDSRYRLVQALIHPQSLSGPDPVRILFVQVWTRLGDIIARAAQHNLLGDRTLDFLSFISAGDALMAFDEVAPAFGMRLTAADLRRLAHIMAPGLATDPLKFSFEEDAELHKLFEVGEALATPSPTAAPPPSETGTPAAAPSPASSLPPPDPDIARGRGGGGLGGLFGSLFAPAPAFAAQESLAAIIALGRRLAHKVPDPNNVDQYTLGVDQLLQLIADRESDAQGARDLRRFYPALVKTTAWQESCWRQFVLKDGRVTYLESATGDIGLMQVNKYVWRGFYDIGRLQADVVYNAGVGSQILSRLMRGCRGARRTAFGALAELARAAYSAYNGGPQACDRWRRRGVPREQREIDAAFWQKYRTLERGSRIDVLRCAAERGSRGN